MSAAPTTPPVATAATGRETADLLIDAARLSSLVGSQVRAARLRHKSGLSTVGALLPAGPQVGSPHPEAPGWVQATRPEHLDKLRNALRRSADRGQHIHVARVPDTAGELHLAHGDLDTDPRLQRGLDAVRTAYPSVRQAVAGGRLTVLRYNPQRRLVLRRDTPGQPPTVVRVTADKQYDLARTLAAVAAAGVPIVEPAGTGLAPRTRRVSVWPWYGIGHLGAPGCHPSTQRDAAAEAGVALATLHRASGLTEGTQAALGAEAGTAADTRAALGPLVADLTLLDPDAGQRMGVLAEWVADQLKRTDHPTGPVHGDFSADQVLVGGPEESGVRLIDLDRAGVGPLAADLGSFAAVEFLEAAGLVPVQELPLTASLVAGYRGAGGALPDSPVLRAWTARALLARVLEPFRDADPDWLPGVHHRLDQVEGVLDR